MYTLNHDDSKCIRRALFDLFHIRLSNVPDFRVPCDRDSFMRPNLIFFGGTVMTHHIAAEAEPPFMSVCVVWYHTVEDADQKYITCYSANVCRLGHDSDRLSSGFPTAAPSFPDVAALAVVGRQVYPSSAPGDARDACFFGFRFEQNIQ